MIRSALLLALLGAVPFFHAAHAAPDLLTKSERSAFQVTGRYDEVIRLCAAFQQAYPKAVRCIDFGRTPEGRPMKALVVTRSGAFTAAAAKQRGLPVTLVQGLKDLVRHIALATDKLAQQRQIERNAADHAAQPLTYIEPRDLQHCTLQQRGRLSGPAASRHSGGGACSTHLGA